MTVAPPIAEPPPEPDRPTSAGPAMTIKFSWAPRPIQVQSAWIRRLDEHGNPLSDDWQLIGQVGP